MGASHFVWIGNIPQEIKNQFLPLLKTLSLEWWPVQSNFFSPHKSNLRPSEESTHEPNPSRWHKSLFPKWNTLSSKERNFCNKQVQRWLSSSIGPNCFSTIHCKVWVYRGGETRQTFWGTGQNVVGSTLISDFQVKMHFTSMCVKYL